MYTNLLESKEFIPWVTRQSRDVQAFCKIFDLLINYFKTNVDFWINLIDFDGCPNELLPLLASYVGYKYDYSESYDTNRLIIKNYPGMIRNRGSEIGIALATALSVNTLGEIDVVEALSMFTIDYVRSENRIDIYVFFPANLTKMRELVEVVRPAGCGLQMIPADLVSTIDGIIIHSYMKGQKYGYESTRYTVDREDRVGFGEVENIKHIYSIENGTHDEYHNKK